VHHESFRLERFAERLPELIARDNSLMLYIDPFRERVTVELRRYADARPAGSALGEWQWRLRNLVWSKLAPRLASLVTRHVPGRRVRSAVLDAVNRLQLLALRTVVRGRRTLPQAQQIRYPAVSDDSRYTFSIWAFPEDRYVDNLRRYVRLCQDHHRRTGYRTNLLSVGYRINADQSSLFSYSYDGTVITFDPVSTGGPGWEQFLHEYNDMCSELGGVPLFNQTHLLTRAHVERAFGTRIRRFDEYRRRFDPADRLLNDYFRELLAEPATEVPAQQVGATAGEPAEVPTQR
jgi:FAD/FMN-containing dehydrogenase